MRPQEPTSPHFVSFSGVRPLASTHQEAGHFRARFIKARGAHALGKPSRRRSMGLVIVRSGRDLLIDTASVEDAHGRLLKFKWRTAAFDAK
jgi:hypothetical protein